MNKPVENDGFTLVSFKSKKRRKPRTTPSRNLDHQDRISSSDQDQNQTIDENHLKRSIESAKNELYSSLFYTNTTELIRECLTSTLGSHSPPIANIICYGLGQVSQSVISRYQFTFLLGIADLCHPVTPLIEVYDPQFTDVDKRILCDYGCKIILKNELAKRTVHELTLFYLPHCPKQLTNNILRTNWSIKNLKNCVIIANSITRIVEQTSVRDLAKNGEFIARIANFVQESPFANTFRHKDIFNDLSVHVFSENVLSHLDTNFWDKGNEPEYDSDCELITSN